MPGFDIVPLEPLSWANRALDELAEEVHELVLEATPMLIPANSACHIG
ncbi:MAG: hypothetical protein AAF415_08710 [Pseudomonadota bacterium]